MEPYCSNLTNITIPDGVTTIYNYAFSCCSGLTSVTIPNSVVSVGDGIFRSCSALSEFKGKFASSDGRCLIVDGVLKSFAPAGLTEYTIPDGVTAIGDSVFAGCDNLTSVTIPNGVTAIGNSVFANCYNLTSVTIPDSVVSFGNDSVVGFGISPFYGCNALSEFRGKLASNDGRCLIIDGVLRYFAPGGLTEYTIPDEATVIGDFAFCSCYLTGIVIPDSVTAIGSGAFEDCRWLSVVTIAESVTQIDNYAFWGCDRLSSIVIPSSVTALGSKIFYNCKSLSGIYLKSTTPPTFEPDFFTGNIDGLFGDSSYNAKIYVPFRSLNAYKTAEGWSMYAEDFVAYDFENDKMYGMEKVDLLTDQLSSPFTASYESIGLEGLVDGDVSTYWHSVYNNTPGDDTYGYYIDIALDEPLSHFCFRYCTRYNNNNAVPALVTIGGSHNGTDWTVIAYDIECVARGFGEWYMLPSTSSNEAYEYLRFGVTESAGGAGGNLKGEKTDYICCVGMSELELYEITE